MTLARQQFSRALAADNGQKNEADQTGRKSRSVRHNSPHRKVERAAPPCATRSPPVGEITTVPIPVNPELASRWGGRCISNGQIGGRGDRTACCRAVINHRIQFFLQREGRIRLEVLRIMIEVSRRRERLPGEVGLASAACGKPDPRHKSHEPFASHGHPSRNPNALPFVSAMPGERFNPVGESW